MFLKVYFSPLCSVVNKIWVIELKLKASSLQKSFVILNNCEKFCIKLSTFTGWKAVAIAHLSLPGR